MSKTIKILSIIQCFLDILAMALVWFMSDITTLKVCCFLWIFATLMSNIREIRRGF
ncbi:hypothetical protein ACRTAL_002269 [Clostridium perfringens]